MSGAAARPNPAAARSASSLAARLLLPLLGALAGGGVAYGLSRLGAPLPPLPPGAPAWQIAATHFTLFGIHSTLGAVLGLAAGVLAAEAVRRRSG